MINSNHLDTIRRNANSGDGGNWGPEIEGLNEAVEKLSVSIAPEFSTLSNYDKDALAIVEGRLMKAKQSITAGEYDPTKWEEADIASNTGSKIKKVTWSGDDSGEHTHTLQLDNASFVLGVKGVRSGVYDVVLYPFYLFDSQKVNGFGGYPEDALTTTATFSEGSLTFTGTNNATGMNDPDATYELYYI